MRGAMHLHDPATGELVGTVEATPIEEVGAAIARARAAAPGWRALGAEGRRDLLRRAAPSLEADSDRLATLLTREMGKPRREAMGELRSCLSGLGDGLDEIAAALAPETLERRGIRTTVYRDPHGVCAAISPWNFPVSMPHSLIVPALMAGNTVVFKPSELTPLIGEGWARHLVEVLPAGVLEVVHGDEEQGRALVQGDVDLVAFTGSREAGAQILAAAGPRLVRVVLELGGKDPMIVLADADVEQAATFAARNAFRNAGQVCVSTERIYVAAEIAERFEERLVALAQALVVGNGATDGVEVGPMISPRQKAHVVRQVRDAVGQGAQIRCGDLDGEGNFLRPMVLTGVDHRMALMRDETFGPVVGVMRFDADDDAVRLANDSPYGLGATVFGEDAHAREIARRLDAGMIGVNRGVGAPGSPWVGAKQSGYGFHSGVEGHRQFAQVRIVSC